MATLLHRQWLSEYVRHLFPDRVESQEASGTKENPFDPEVASRCELVESALQQGIPFQEIEDYLEYLDQCQRS